MTAISQYIELVAPIIRYAEVKILPQSMDRWTIAKVEQNDIVRIPDVTQ